VLRAGVPCSWFSTRTGKSTDRFNNSNRVRLRTWKGENRNISWGTKKGMERIKNLWSVKLRPSGLKKKVTVEGRDESWKRQFVPLFVKRYEWD